MSNKFDVTIPCYDFYVSSKLGNMKPMERRYKLCLKPRSITGYMVLKDGCEIILSNREHHCTHLTEAELKQYISGDLKDSNINYMDFDDDEYIQRKTKPRLSVQP